LQYSGARRDSAWKNKNREEPMSKSFLRTFAACALLVPVGALASPITVNFTITATQSMSNSGVITPGGSYAGYATGTVGGGSFTFDDSLGQSSDLTNGLPTLDLDFTWLGQSFTEATATLWSLSFDSTGALSGWGLGRRGVEENCQLNCASSIGPTDFSISGFMGANDAGFMHVDGFYGFMFGSTAWNVAPTGVPEPSTLILLGGSLLGMRLARRRRKN
jgi:hypothetical protein